MTFPVTEHTLKTERHTTGYLACGPESGPLLIFCHGWPELSLSWRHQLPAMAALGFRCIAPDMRGYGRSSTYTRHEDFAQELIVQDMIELLDALGRDKAVWVGHDWGSPVVWNIAAHHADRTAGVASLCVPYLAEGFTLENIVAAGRPQDLSRGRVPGRAVGLPVLLRGELRQGLRGLRGQHPQHREGAVPQGRSQVGRQAEPHGIRRARTAAGSGADGLPDVPRDADVMTEQDLEAYTAALTRNGFFGPELLVHEPQGQRRLRRGARRTAASSPCPCCSCTAPTTSPARP